MNFSEFFGNFWNHSEFTYELCRKLEPHTALDVLGDFVGSRLVSNWGGQRSTAAWWTAQLVSCLCAVLYFEGIFFIFIFNLFFKKLIFKKNKKGNMQHWNRAHNRALHNWNCPRKTQRNGHYRECLSSFYVDD